jgi:DegV family protein with EDD domain
MGLGGLCLAAARLAAAGASLDAVAADVLRRRERTRLFGVLDTLEYLRRGGRIGNARALVGSILSVKPVIEVRGGKVEAAGRVRTRARGLQFLAERASEHPLASLHVLHGAAPDVDALLDRLDSIMPRAQIVTGQVGPVIGAHAGPGVIGVAFETAADAGDEP